MVLETLAIETPNTKHLAMTIHDPKYGLDEVEAFLAQFAGCIYAFFNGKIPSKLQTVSIIENKVKRVQRLRHALEDRLVNMPYASKVSSYWAYRLFIPHKLFGTNESLKTERTVDSAGIDSESKSHVFVAMPFSKEMDDVFFTVYKNQYILMDYCVNYLIYTYKKGH
ncbi:hypothetical protein [uncultured Methanolobus sp.]|uniref:hypothetical protein n=1 Tax=uncultured Methanolobus sp. TaxID=218300 RepID=UPI002AAB3923|nr:hypothetical protein [uncultured Methanolobus sp.]